MEFIVKQSNLFTFNMDVGKWQWDQLISWSTFRWQVGKTPFSDLRVIVIAWIVYFSTIIALKAFMTNREPFRLKAVTAYHNMFLCLVSIAMFVFGAIGTFNRASELGVDEIFCTNDGEGFHGLLTYTMYVYYLSKFIELFDTVILVLKKKPLIFLHWYHHAIVILMVWSWLQFKVAFATQGMLANTFIHVFMYYYYYASSLGHDVWFKKYITTGQIIQFTLSFILAVPYVYFHTQKGCLGWNAFVFSMVINGSFLGLFIQFYLRTYKKTARKLKTQ